MHNEDLNDLCIFPSTSGVRKRWERPVACMWADHNMYRVLVGKSEGKRLSG
jgi:hypothetical protein